ncbi:ester cyclase [Actinomycetes bacterium KLBMP 9797]
MSVETMTLSTEEKKAHVLRIFEEIANGNNLDAAHEVYADDFLDHLPFPGAGRGPEGAKYSITQMKTAFPDMHITVEDISAHEDYVVVHNTWRGTHRGKVLGVQPTGRKMTFGGPIIFRFEGRKIAERWAIGFDVSFLRELGLGLQWGRAN